jgi:hypothetical protein
MTGGEHEGACGHRGPVICHGGSMRAPVSTGDLSYATGVEMLPPPPHPGHSASSQHKHHCFCWVFVKTRVAGLQVFSQSPDVPSSVSPPQQLSPPTPTFSLQQEVGSPPYLLPQPHPPAPNRWWSGRSVFGRRLSLELEDDSSRIDWFLQNWKAVLAELEGGSCRIGRQFL